ncbi:DUF2306 domain-containing protein [Shimia ponticola]|uniref:DUF2306 domain-containing protein n=1 Tax=Shimia ponticola TaxID=2582893 RepID=UPI0011BEA695|nr:DUF2306 domain-containing protein [Shimia ponticola]
MRLLSRADWLFLAGILIFSFIPAVFGLFRIPGLLLGLSIIPANPRAVIDPAPIILHVASSSIFCLLGAFQFLPRLRYGRPILHRRMGRVLAIAGLISALTGLWMTVVYPFPETLQGPLLFWVRALISVAMAGCIVHAVCAARNRQFPLHRAQMLRAYAIAQGASTQTVLFIVAMAATGTETLGFSRDVLMVSAWVLNLIFAELLIRRSPRGTRPAIATPPAE